MNRYSSLFNITVEHDFFSDGVCPCLEFVPSAESERIIRNCGLLIRRRRGGIGVSYDQERSDALIAHAEDQAEPLCFEFKVYATDPQFKSYSEPFAALPGGTILYFDNRQDNAITGSDVKLHTSEYVTTISSTKLESPQLRDLLSQKDRLIPPLFVVKIYALGDESALFRTSPFAITGKNYRLSFKSRQTIWKYYLLGGIAGKSAYIFDPDGRVEFEFAGEEPLSDDRPSMIFRSKMAIPLKQRQSLRFQLKERGAGGERVLIKRLPVAGVGQFGKEVVSEQGLVVSEIYINC